MLQKILTKLKGLDNPENFKKIMNDTKMMGFIKKEMGKNQELREVINKIHQKFRDQNGKYDIDKGESEHFVSRMKSHHDARILNRYVSKESASEEDLDKILNSSPTKDNRIIYVHTPFCDKICSFCNLNRSKLGKELNQYTDYIVSEFQRYGKKRYVYEKPFKVIYFGGGTPTVYNNNQMERILSTIRENIELTHDYEWTFETTLHNLTLEKLEIMKKYGVNRLSIGIQTFSDRGREFLNRTFDKKRTIEKLKELRKNFDGCLCIDIIYSYSNQTIDEVKEDAKLIKELKIDSASFYSLMIHDGSKLSKDIKNKEIEINTSLQRDMRNHSTFMEELLADENYELLELTKIKRKHRDRYNYIMLRNNGDSETLPIGVGAGGSVGGIGIYQMNENVKMLSKSTSYHIKYSKLTGMMQFPEMNLNKFKDLLSDVQFTKLIEKFEEFVNKKFMEKRRGNYYLTNLGVFWGNNISVDIISELIEIEFGKEKEK